MDFDKRSVAWRCSFSKDNMGTFHVKPPVCTMHLTPGDGTDCLQAEMEGYEVSTLVNSAANDGPE